MGSATLLAHMSGQWRTLPGAWSVHIRPQVLAKHRIPSPCNLLTKKKKGGQGTPKPPPVLAAAALLDDVLPIGLDESCSARKGGLLCRLK